MPLNTPQQINRRPKDTRPALMPPPPKPTFYLETDTKGEQKLFKANPNAPVPPSIMKNSTEYSKPEAQVKPVPETLSDPALPLGIDIQTLDLSTEQKEALAKRALELGRFFEDFRSVRQIQVGEIENALSSIVNTNQGEVIRGHVDYLRGIKSKIEEYYDDLQFLRVFFSEHQGFASLGEEIISTKKDFKNANSGEKIIECVGNLTNFKNLCASYVQIDKVLKDNIRLLSTEDRIKITSLSTKLKNSGYGNMIDAMNELRLISKKYEMGLSAEDEEKIQSYKRERDDLITTLNTANSDQNLTEMQKTRFAVLFEKVLRYEVDKKTDIAVRLTRSLENKTPENQALIKEQINDLERLTFDNYIARYDYDETMVDMEYFNKEIEATLLLEELNIPTETKESSGNLNTSDTTTDKSIFRYPDQTTEILANTGEITTSQKNTTIQKGEYVKPTSPLPIKPTETITNNPTPQTNNRVETQKPSGIFQNARSWLSKLTPRAIISTLTASTIALATPATVEKGFNKDTLNPPEVSRLIKSLNEADLGKGELAKTLQELQNADPTITKVAETRVSKMLPVLSVEQQRDKARRFVDSAFRSQQQNPQQEPAVQILRAARDENQNKPQTVEKLTEAERIYNENK
jgi:hypothetical protein